MGARSSADATMIDMADLYDTNRAREFSSLIFAHGMSAALGQPIATILDALPGLGRLREKATVAGGSTTSIGALAGDIATRAFLQLMARRTVLGRLTGTLSAPPNALVPTPATDPIATWITDGAPMPLALMTFSDPRTDVAKYGTLHAFTRELFRLADDRTISMIERITLRALAHAEDTLLLSNTAAVSGGAPAGLLNGLSAIGGGSPASIADLELVWSECSEGDPTMPYFVCSPRGAMHLAGLNVAGQPMFPSISPATGGTIAGVPVLLSKAAAHRLILLDAALIAVSDQGLDVGQSEQAAIQFVDNPTNNSATATPTNMVSAFQASAVILRFVRWLHWVKLTSDAVAFIELPIAGSPA